MFKQTDSNSANVHYLAVPKQHRRQKKQAAQGITKWCWYIVRLILATAVHYGVMTVLLLSLKFRNAGLVLGAAYCLNFYFSHNHHLWIDSDFTAVWVSLGCLFLAICGKITATVEEDKPFHSLLKLGKQTQIFDRSLIFEAANDDVLKRD